MNGIENYFGDIVMEAPHAFTAGGETYHLYPLCLGKMMLVQRLLADMNIDMEAVGKWPIIEVIKLVGLYRDNCLTLLAYVTAKTKDDCFDVKRTKAVMKALGEQSDEDIATLMVYILTDDRIDEVRKYYEIDKEAEAMNAVIKVKSQGGSLSFGGKTVLGAIIDQACERYGWTLEYVVWGISYATLRMLMYDRVNTLYLTEDERKKVPPSVLQRDEEVIKATKETMAQIKSMSWK